jgi:type IV pilus assembly protein PilB
MVGEIRDAETAEISIKAAQTGHMVLSTLHTNDSIAAITRLIDIGVPSYQIAAALTGVVAQRLVRKLCTCSRRVAATQEFISRMRLAGVPDVPHMQNIPTGCDICDLTGYKGRTGIYELLALSPAMRDAIRSGQRNDDIRSLALQSGMRFMRDQALERVVEGLTTLDEVQRVIPMEERASAACLACHFDLSESNLFCPHCGEKVRGDTAYVHRPEHPELQGATRR